MNKPSIRFSGNVAAKPTLRPVNTPNGPVVTATLRVAVTPRRKAPGTDEWHDDETMWFNVSTWRGVAQNCVASLNQGDRVLVAGTLSQRTWKDAEGVEHASFEVAAEDVALDLSRNAAVAVRRPAPVQRRGEQDPGDEWVSTGRVDEATGEVLVERTGAAETEALDDDDVDAPEVEPAVV